MTIGYFPVKITASPFPVTVPVPVLERTTLFFFFCTVHVFQVGWPPNKLVAPLIFQHSLEVE